MMETDDLSIKIDAFLKRKLIIYLKDGTELVGLFFKNNKGEYYVLGDDSKNPRYFTMKQIEKIGQSAAEVTFNYLNGDEVKKIQQKISGLFWILDEEHDKLRHIMPQLDIENAVDAQLVAFMLGLDNVFGHLKQDIASLTNFIYESSNRKNKQDN